MYYIIDLERSIGSGLVFYWKLHKRGYTTNLSDAGLYSELVAKEIVESDFDKQSIMVHKNVVEQILRD